MFGCLGRLVFLGVLLVVGAVGYLTRDWWWPKVRGRVVAEAPATVTWTPVDEAAATRARAVTRRLTTARGAAFENVTAAEFAALYLEPVVRLLADTAAHPEAAVEGDRLLVRMRVALADLGGPQTLGPLTGMLQGRQPVLLGGRIEPVSAGLAQFRLTEVAINQVRLPSPAVAQVAARVGMAARSDSVARDALPLPLPAPVGDVRVARGRVTLYRGAP